MLFRSSYSRHSLSASLITQPFSITDNTASQKEFLDARAELILDIQSSAIGPQLWAFEEEIVQKMVEGRLRKYYEEVALSEQTYVIDGETKVSKAVEAAP